MPLTLKELAQQVGSHWEVQFQSHREFNWGRARGLHRYVRVGHYRLIQRLGPGNTLAEARQEMLQEILTDIQNSAERVQTMLKEFDSRMVNRLFRRALRADVQAVLLQMNQLSLELQKPGRLEMMEIVQEPLEDRSTDVESVLSIGQKLWVASIHNTPRITEVMVTDLDCNWYNVSFDVQDPEGRTDTFKWYQGKLHNQRSGDEIFTTRADAREHMRAWARSKITDLSVWL